MTAPAYDREPDARQDSADARKQAFIRRVRRAACALARTRRYSTADDLAVLIPKPPGVDGRNVGGALHGLRALGLIEPIAYGRTARKDGNGRPQALWKVLDPDGCGQWLAHNPPGPEHPPTTVQRTLF